MAPITHKLPGLLLTDHFWRVPLDHASLAGEQISVFAREVTAAGRETRDLPWLVFFQGGPGYGAPRPLDNSGWIKRAVQEYRVLLLDQRGTGLSTPLTLESLLRRGDAQAQAAYLKHFRADAIVQDAEWIRRQLLGEQGKWSVLGQSFGGFCVVHYLSAAPASLKEALITGGLPSLTRPADDVYRATYRRVLEKNRLYYERYPDDVARVQTIVEHLASHDVRLPGGDRLTPHRFQQLGLAFGASDGFQQVHYLLEEAFAVGGNDEGLSYIFLRGFEHSQSYDTNPIFAILHEAVYCQGEASRWSAQRLRSEYPQFEITAGQPVYFTGEMIYPWMFAEYGRLQPLQAAAELLAHDVDWPQLYDPAVLATNRVPCAAAVYYNDMYVERQFSEETAQMVRGIKLWVTNEVEHNALRADGEALLGRLLDMVRGA